MSIENPEQYIGSEITIKRFGKQHRAMISKTKGNSFVVPILIDGRPQLINVPFVEVKSQLQNNGSR